MASATGLNLPSRPFAFHANLLPQDIIQIRLDILYIAGKEYKGFINSEQGNRIWKLAGQDFYNETTPSIEHERLDAYLKSYLIVPSLLRTDRFADFMADRQKRLLTLIEQATGKAAYISDVQEEGEDVEAGEDTVEAKLTIAAE